MKSTTLIRLISFFALLAAAGCGGGGTAAVSGGPGAASQEIIPALSGGFDLASPDQLIRGLSFTGEDRLVTGSRFMPPPNSANLNSIGSSAQFVPQYVAPDRLALSDAAYGIYVFNIETFTGSEELQFSWSVPPTETENLFIGLGHHLSNSWHWFPGSAGEPLPLDPFSAYVTGNGLLLVAVVLVGDQPATLDWIRAGGATGPSASAVANPATGSAPLEVTLDASGSVDYGGNIVSYAWDLDEDLVYETGPFTEPTHVHTFFSAGTFDIGLQVTDDDSETDVTTVTVVVNIPGNQPPNASVSAVPESGSAPLDVSFDGSASNDPDGTITRYEWDWDGNGVYDLDTGSNPLANHIFNSEGTYEVVMRVTDDNDVSDTDTVSISVTSGSNLPPVAVIDAAPRHGNAPLIVSLDATGSFDTDGNIVKYEYDWEGDGGFEEHPSTIQHTYSVPGNYDCVLRVTDDLGATDTASYRVTAGVGGAYDEFEDNDTTSQANAVPEFNFTDFSASLGPDGYNGDDDDWYQLRLTDSNRYTIYMHGFLDVDADLDMKLFRIDGTTQVGTSTGTDDDEEIVWVCDETGIYYLRCYVYNESGSSDYLLDISELVLVRPTADLTANPASGDWPLTVDLDASGSFDPDGTIETYDWDWDGNGSYDLTGETQPTIQHEFTTAGTFNTTVRVTDNDGAQDTAFVEITVLNDAPVADFTADPTSGNRPLVVNFDASASYDPDPGGGIAKYQWDFDGNGTWDLTKTDSSDDPPLATATYWALGTFDATLRVTDVAGATDDFSMSITVNGDPDNESEPNNDQDTDHTVDDLALADSFPAFPFSGWLGTVGPKPIPDGDFGDPDDWYKFTVDSAGEVYLYMELFDAICDIDMALYDSELNSLQVSGNVDDDEDITEQLEFAGTYYLRVYAFTSAPAQGGYRLQGTFTP